MTGSGQALAETARSLWQTEVETAVLLSVLLVHDVHKAILWAPGAGRAERSPVAAEHLHGLLGAQLLGDAGLPERVTEIVATHSHDSPAHSQTAEGWLLRHADSFAACSAFLGAGLEPLCDKGAARSR